MSFRNFPTTARSLALTAIFVLLATCGQQPASMKDAPPFQLKDIQGGDVALEHFRGKVVLVDFWATWCPPCRESIPELVELQSRYRDEGLVILGVSVDDPGRVSDEALSAFKKHFRMNYRILRASNEMALSYFGKEQMAIPTMFVIDRMGRIAGRHVGFAPGAVEKSIKKLL